MDAFAKEKLGDKLRYYRNKLGYSQEYVAQMMGKNDHTAYQRLETGRTEIKLDDFVKLAKIFDVSLHDLLNIENPIQSEKVNSTIPVTDLSFTLHLDGDNERFEAQVELARKLNDVLTSK